MADARRDDGPYSRHGAIDMGARKPFDGPLWPPADSAQQSDLGTLDPRLAAEGRAIDRGVALSGINDGFTGAAPDLGCCEAGVALPHYGPR